MSLNYHQEISSQEESSYDIQPQDYLNVLQKSFKLNKFKPLQLIIIQSLIENKRDNIFINATGYGKSICYQFPAIYLNGISLIVSPFISLMQDQVQRMKKNDISACLLGSAQRNKSIVNDISNGLYSIVYVTPEFISGDRGTEMLSLIKDKVVMIGIDEAHCVSKYGHSFRKNYLKLSNIREYIPNVPILAVSSIATKKITNDIEDRLELKNPQILSTGFQRSNFQFYVRIINPTSTIWSNFYNYMEEHKNESTIICCKRRKLTEEIVEILKKRGIKCGAYHAGMTMIQREKIHEKFMTNQINVIVATIAFGMGINKPDVRLVIHYGKPRDMETYYSEVGFAGRDGKSSKCILFYKPTSYKKRHNMTDYFELRKCRQLFIQKYFEGENAILSPKKSKKCCDNCLKNEQKSCDNEDIEFSLRNQVNSMDTICTTQTLMIDYYNN